MRKRVVLLAFISSIAWISGTFAQTSSAAAEEMSESSESVSAEKGTRDGWVLGIGPLAGVPLNNDCTDCTNSGAFGLDMQLGRMLNPRLALMLDTHGVGVGRSDVAAGGVSTSSVVQGVAAIALQWWPQEDFWAKGGIGHGQAEGTVTAIGVDGASAELTGKETGFGMILAAGYEIHQGQTFVLDLHVMYAGIHTEPKYRGNLVLGLGFAWYL